MVRLYELKRELNKMRMAVAPLQDVLAQLRRYQGELVPDEVKLYIRDVHDHAVRISDVIDTLREMLGTALSVNLSLVTLAQGETVKRPVRGRAAGGTDADHQLVRDELQPHAGAEPTVGLPTDDRWCGRRLRGPVPVVQARKVVVTRWW